MSAENTLKNKLEEQPEWSNLSEHDKFEIKKFKLYLEMKYNEVEDAYGLIYDKKDDESRSA